MSKGDSKSQRKNASDRTATPGSACPTRKGGKPGKPVVAAVVQQKKPRISRAELVCWAALLLAASTALLWKHRSGYFLSWTDEQIHYYVARRIAEGAVLYRDAQSARPPLALFPIAWLIKAGCTPLLAGRTMVFGTQLATAALLARAGRLVVSWRPGALVALLFLTARGGSCVVYR